MSGQIEILADFISSFFLQNYQSSPVSEFCLSSLAIIPWLRMLLKVLIEVTVPCLMISSELSGVFWEMRKVTWRERDRAVTDRRGFPRNWWNYCKTFPSILLIQCIFPTLCWMSDPEYSECYHKNRRSKFVEMSMERFC